VTENGRQCTTITFEGIGDLAAIPDFDGISSPGWLGLIDADAGGSGNFAFEPSPETIAFWLGGAPGSRDIVLTNPASKVEFFYASFVPIRMDAYDESGKLLATVVGAPNYRAGPGGDPTGDFNKWDPLKVEVDSNQIKTVRVSGNVNQTGIDNLKVCTTLGVDSIEVTQAIQEWQKLDDFKTSLKTTREPPVPIVAGKPAVLRVYMKKVEAVTEVQMKVSGAINNTKRISLQPQCTPEKTRRNENGCTSVNFYFTPPAGSWDLKVELLDKDDKLLETHDLPLQSRKSDSLTLRAVQVCDAKDAAGKWLCEPARKLLGIDRLIKKITPTASISTRTTNHIVRRDSSVYTDISKWWRDTANDVNAFFTSATTGQHLTYLGMVRPSITGTILGIAAGIPSNAAIAKSTATDLGTDISKENVAHELYHTMAQKHTNTGSPSATTSPGCSGVAVDPSTTWPYADNTIQSGPKSKPQSEVGFDVAARKVLLPESTFDIMGYCIPQWIAPINYRGLLSNLNGVTTTVAATAAVASTVRTGTFWLVSGTIAGSSAALDPLFEFQATADDGAGSGTYRIDVSSSAGSVLFTRRFTPQIPVIEDRQGVSAPSASFAEWIPITAGAARITVFSDTGANLGSLQISGTKPVVTIQAPGGPVNWSGSQSIVWTVLDSDSTQHTSRVYYSVDNGTSWSEIGKVFGVNSLLVDFNDLPGAAGTARIMLSVSDGINSGTAVSPAFSVNLKSTIDVAILSPESGAAFPIGDPISIEGRAFDVDDGVLTGDSLQWESNLNGALGIGETLSASGLSAGQHTITLTATDKQGNKGVAFVPIAIAGGLPSVSLTVTPLDTLPTTCVQALINALPESSGVPLTTIEYSLNAGRTWTAIPIGRVPFTFIVPGSGFFHLIARTYDAAGQLAAADAKFFTDAVCQRPIDTTPPVITPQINGTIGSNGWYRSNVSIDWIVNDPESGIVSSVGCSPVILNVDTPGTTFTCSATNGAGLSASQSVSLKVDKTAPIIAGMPAACRLWPPNHQLSEVATVSAVDNLAGLMMFAVSGTSNEAENGLGDGDVAPDIVITGTGLSSRTVQLRAERSGTGTGRIYTLTATASDQAGNSSTAIGDCRVPHDQSK